MRAIAPRKIGIDYTNFLVQATAKLVFWVLLYIDARGARMAMNETASTGSGEESARVPMMQRILDNPFLLLFLGVTIPTVLYLLWGVMEIASVPLAK